MQFVYILITVRLFPCNLFDTDCSLVFVSSPFFISGRAYVSNNKNFTNTNFHFIMVQT